MAARRRLPLVIGFAVAGLAVGILLGSTRGTSHIAEATVVLEDPQARNSSSLVPASPERYVNGQLAVFDLADHHQLTAEIATALLESEARLAAESRTFVGTDPAVAVSADGSLTIDEPVVLTRAVDGTTLLPQTPSAPRIGPDRTLANAAEEPLLDENGLPLRVGAGDQLLLRADGLLVVHRTDGELDVTAPDGTALDIDGSSAEGDDEAAAEAEVSRAADLGLTTDDTGVALASGPLEVRFVDGSQATVVDPDGAVLRRPDTGALVGPAASTLLLHEGLIIAITADELVIAEPDGAVTVTDTFGTIVASSENAAVRTDGTDGPVVEVTAVEVRDGLVAEALDESYVLEIEFASGEPDRSIAVVNSAVDAYRELQQRGASGQQAASVAAADATLAELSDELLGAEARLTELRVASGSALIVEDQYEAVIAEIAEASDGLLLGGGTADADRLRDLLVQLEAIEAVRRVELLQPEIAEATANRDRILSRLEQLQADRDAVLIGGQQDQIIALESPAFDTTASSGLGAGRLGFVGLVLGVLLGSAVAYLIEIRAPRRLSDPVQLENMLGAPLLTQVPNYREERITADVPILANPESYVAEAYRIGAAAVTIAARSNKATLIGVVSAEAGDGKTSTALNLGIALAQSGRRVLLVDSDLEGHVLGDRLLHEAGHDQRTAGIADVLRGERDLEDCIQRIELESMATLSLVSAGTESRTARHMVGADRWSRLFRDVRRANFEIVLVDLAPLLSVAYASSVMQELHGVVAVVDATAAEATVADLAARFEFGNTNLFGFIQNRARLRKERSLSKSMAMPPRSSPDVDPLVGEPDEASGSASEASRSS